MDRHDDPLERFRYIAKCRERVSDGLCWRSLKYGEARFRQGRNRQLTGDFDAGYYYQHKKFKLKPFIWRVGTVKEMIRTGKYVPLKEIVRYSQGQYYGSSEYGTSGGHHYAQGWSFIYFMRTGPKKSRKWNEAWDHILQTYLDTLAETGDLDRAVDVAFEGVDWDELEEAWKDYIG